MEVTAHLRPKIEVAHCNSPGRQIETSADYYFFLIEGLSKYCYIARRVPGRPTGKMIATATKLELWPSQNTGQRTLGYWQYSHCPQTAERVRQLQEKQETGL